MILVVDDDEDVRDAIFHALRVKGYEVLTAEDGQRGLTLLAGQRVPCVVLLDLVMPVMDGWQFLSAIKQDPALQHIPVVVVSAHASTHPPSGISEILRKPFAFTDLYDAVARYCGPP